MDETVRKKLFMRGEDMSIYEMYIEDDYFRNEVDKFVRKHRTTLKAAIRSITIQRIYCTHLQFLSHAQRDKLSSIPGEAAGIEWR